jgi:hypothetical protein
VSSSSEEEYHQYKIFKKQTSIAAGESDPNNKGHIHEGKLLGALNMYTKKALIRR